MRPSHALLVRALAGALLGGMLSLAPSTATTSAAGPAPGSGEVRVGTYNIRADRGLTRFQRAVEALKPRVDVAGLQEITGRHKHAHLQSDPGWGYHRPPERGQNPVIWDRSVFVLVGTPAKSYRIASGRKVEAKDGSGLERKRTSIATVVRLRHRLTLQTLSVINVHLLSGAAQLGRPLRNRPRRFRLLVDQIQGTRAVVREERQISDEVFLLGDFNVGFQADVQVRHRKLPYRRYGQVRLRSMWQGARLGSRGTYGRAYLDQVWSDSAPVARRVAHDIRQSDHRPAVATYLLEPGLPTEPADLLGPPELPTGGS